MFQTVRASWIIAPAAFLHPENAPKSLATGEAYSAPPDPLAGLRGPTSKGRGGKGRGGEGRAFRLSSG